MNAQQLSEKKAEYQAAIATLVAERATLAPQLYNGYAKAAKAAARKRIKQIDAQRLDLASEVESIEQALASPEYRELSKQELMVQRLEVSFKSKLARNMGALKGELQDRYQSLQIGDNLARASTPRETFDITTLPYQEAARLTGEAYARTELQSITNANRLHGGDPRYDNSAKQAELELRLKIYEGHTATLLARTDLPPIPDALKPPEPEHLKVRLLSPLPTDPEKTKAHLTGAKLEAGVPRSFDQMSQAEQDEMLSRAHPPRR